MLENLIGEDMVIYCFKVNYYLMQKYTAKFVYSTPDTEDFLTLIFKTTGQKRLYDFIKNYVLNSGIPVIYVEDINHDGIFSLTQERFLISSLLNVSNSSISNIRKDELHWTIPINYITETKEKPKNLQWLTNKSSIYIYIQIFIK